MKLFIVLALVAVAAARPDGDHYDTKYDDLDVIEILNNERLAKGYIKCFKDEGKCTPEGTDIKKYIPDAISSGCAKCTDKQKKLAATFIKGMQSKYSDDYEALYKIHDPEGKSGDELKKFIDTYAA